ncbi:MAG: hypothetical protein U9O87_02755 [Verrucomicrobiota bacterium]|nr:hypothetical protein [Verrucomicrobiota bacterium]
MIIDLFKAIEETNEGNDNKQIIPILRRAKQLFPNDNFVNLILSKELENQNIAKLNTLLKAQKWTEIKSFLEDEIRIYGMTPRLKKMVEVVNNFVALHNYFMKKKQITNSKEYFNEIRELKKTISVLKKEVLFKNWFFAEKKNAHTLFLKEKSMIKKEVIYKKKNLTNKTLLSLMLAQEKLIVQLKPGDIN